MIYIVALKMLVSKETCFSKVLNWSFSSFSSLTFLEKHPPLNGWLTRTNVIPFQISNFASFILKTRWCTLTKAIKNSPISSPLIIKLASFNMIWPLKTRFKSTTHNDELHVQLIWPFLAIQKKIETFTDMTIMQDKNKI